jgi:hypothetical protein
MLNEAGALDALVMFLAQAIPTYDQLLEVVGANGNYFDLVDEFYDYVRELDLTWSERYLDKELLQKGWTIFLRHVANNENPGELFKIQSLTDLINLTTTLVGSMQDDDSESISLPKLNEKTLDNENNKEDEELARETLSITLATIFNQLALMVHGRSMVDLLHDASMGDDEAFCLAAQLDKTVLALEPFQERLKRSQFTKDERFLKMLGRRISIPPIKSRIRYRTLRLTFSFLEGFGLLDRLGHEQIFDICQRVGVYGAMHGVEDVGHISKRLADYRRLQRKSKNF